MKRRWFYLRDGKAHGPYSANKISTWVRSGKLEASTKVVAKGLPEPKPLSEVAIFEDVQRSPKPPPLPSENSLSSRDESESARNEPPPIPSNKEASDAENESPTVAPGAIQTDQDQKTANWMWRASAITLVVLFFFSVIALLPGDDDSGEIRSASSEQGVLVKQQRWPSVFDPENHDYLAEPQPPSISEELVRDIATTYGFRNGQNNSLDRILRDYAGTRIAAQARTSRLRFKSSFGDAYGYIDSLLSQKWGKEWVQAKNRIEEQSASLLGRGAISRSEAKAFVDTVENRSQGRLPSPILETLLMFTPEYIERPENMFNDGFTKEYRTGGHIKSKDIDLGIQYPASWKEEEGRRPHVVQKFTSENGRGSTMAMILVREFPDDLPNGATESDFEKAILALNRDKMFGSVFPGTEVIETGKVRLAGEPTIWGRYKATVNRTGIKIDFHGLVFMMARHGNIVQVMYMAGERLSDESTDSQATFEHYGVLFQRMTNSIEFFGRYE